MIWCYVTLGVIGTLLFVIPAGGAAVSAATAAFDRSRKPRPLTERERKIHDRLFESRDEIVEFPADVFAGYEEYDRRNPDRFEVRYDRNGNRADHNRSKR